MMLAAYAPDDGTQGYTPYFYKMDVPVRVTNSISYGYLTLTPTEMPKKPTEVRALL